MAARPSPARSAAPPRHWTHAVYRDHADLFYDVEAALFQNLELTRQELDQVLEAGVVAHDHHPALGGGALRQQVEEGD